MINRRAAGHAWTVVRMILLGWIPGNWCVAEIWRQSVLLVKRAQILDTVYTPGT
jgi:hypothetical protein